MDGYITLRGEGTGEINEKKSRFIARCAPVASEEAASAFVDAVRARHHAARHNVFAYVLRENNLSRYTDDGEPQGTAGIPTLEILRHAGVTDAVMVVTRYFGGTLLGTGGLARAYSAAASLALSDAGTVCMRKLAVYSLQIGYDLHDRVLRLLAACGASMLSTGYGEQVTLRCALPGEAAAAMIAGITELTRGQQVPQYLGERYEPSAEEK